MARRIGSSITVGAAALCLTLAIGDGGAMALVAGAAVALAYDRIMDDIRALSTGRGG